MMKNTPCTSGGFLEDVGAAPNAGRSLSAMAASQLAGGGSYAASTVSLLNRKNL